VDELEDLPGEKPSRISTFGVEFLYLLNRTLQIGLASEPEPAIRSRDSAGRTATGGLRKNALCGHRDDALRSRKVVQDWSRLRDV
jgi:hypothetical protein